MAQTTGHKLNKGFIALTVFLVIANLPQLLKLVIPVHDTGTIFRMFYFFYNELFYNAELPQWLPFGFYGFQSAIMFSMISPACFLTGVFGLIFRVHDVLFLFALGVLIEQFIMLLGLYRLGGLLFKHEATVLAVCASLICGTVYLTQIGLNFRMFHLLPLVLYYAVRYFEDKRPSLLALGLLVSLLWFQGGYSYAVAIPALAIVCIFAALAIAHMPRWREFLVISPREALLSAALISVFAVMLGVYYFYLKGALDEAVLLSAGRNPDSSVTLETFLTFPNAGRLGFAKFLGMAFPVETALPFRLGVEELVTFESTTYIGLIPLCFAAYACVARRSRMVYAVMFAMLVLGLLSLGGDTFVAAALYRWFPLMKYYRHIGYVIGAYQVLVAVLAGYGIDRFITASEAYSPRLKSVSMALLIAAAGAGHLGIYLTMLHFSLIGETQCMVVTSLVFAALAGVYVASRRSLALLLVLCIMIGGASYQAAVDLRLRSITDAAAKGNNTTLGDIVETTFVNPYQYLPARSDEMQSPRQIAASVYSKLGTGYEYDYNFIQADPCNPSLRVDVMNKYIARLSFTRNKGDAYRSDGRGASPCGAPKLRVLGGAAYADSATDLTRMMAELPDISARPVIFGVPTAQRPSDPASGETAVRSFKPNELALEATASDAAWLYYTDAYSARWKAYVNGAPAPVYPANMAFKAVPLPRGRSSVVMRYESPGQSAMQYALIAFGLGMTLLILWDALRAALNWRKSGDAHLKPARWYNIGK